MQEEPTFHQTETGSQLKVHNLRKTASNSYFGRLLFAAIYYILPTYTLYRFNFISDWGPVSTTPFCENGMTRIGVMRYRVNRGPI